MRQQMGVGVESDAGLAATQSLAYGLDGRPRCQQERCMGVAHTVEGNQLQPSGFDNCIEVAIEIVRVDRFAIAGAGDEVLRDPGRRRQPTFKL